MNEKRLMLGIYLGYHLGLVLSVLAYVFLGFWYFLSIILPIIFLTWFYFRKIFVAVFNREFISVIAFKAIVLLFLLFMVVVR